MDLKVGDRVRFINDVGGGTITRIIDRLTVAVMNQDGFEIPVLESEIILVDPDHDRTISKDQYQTTDRGNSFFLDSSKDENNTGHAIVKEQDSKLSNEVDWLSEGVDFVGYNRDNPDHEGELIVFFLGLIPSERHGSGETEHEIYIVNDSPYRAFFTISLWKTGEVSPIKAGFLPADTKEYVGPFVCSEYKGEITLNIQLILFKNIPYTLHKPLNVDLSIDTKKLITRTGLAENDFFEEEALIIPIADSKKELILSTLTDKAVEGSIREKERAPGPKPRKVEPELIEVDLHIQELVDNYSAMQPGEILELQLAHFTSSLNQGLKSRATRKMVFIHGKGNGKLKNEIIDKLKREYPKLRYQDASFREYGFGATLVFLK
ncbi:MAG: DUF2027 domain-containing protein [Tenuifilaceae bacterium]|jgi:hypothetical protein|nr:DUF2027 domain-containing protein [Bacteroidales bacterium]MDI9515773.1 DUF2027 domain-containing protein [Bacteroidota bacterium]NLH57442.1 DUF2027 domain-containing protein [Rikenellaceae bacterium]OQC62175.1 MAG: hypothetical protein BWX49_01842 [Bacteroidetes bacterium ADurb.Bin008]HNV81053.1 DUF2027 domain-containing protein [Tenuifilaceae bacterium]